MKIEVKDIKDLITEYVSEVGSNHGASMHIQWPEIAGKELSDTTEFIKVENGKIIVIAKGSAASSLLMLKKRNIINEFRRRFPSENINGIQVRRTY